MRLWVVIVGGLVAGCASSETVYMNNAAGQEVKCGPYTAYGNIPAANSSTFDALRACMSDFEKQGYRRVQK